MEKYMQDAVEGYCKVRKIKKKDFAEKIGVTPANISLEKPQRKWVSSRLEGKTSWIFSSCGRCSRLTTGPSGTRSGGLI